MFANFKLDRAYNRLFATSLLGMACAVLPPLAVCAESLNLKDLSPVKIINTAKNACGSGVLSGRKIITNYHVAASVCPYSPCSDIGLYSGNNQLLPSEGIIINRGLSAAGYDLAILELEGRALESSLIGLPRAENLIKNQDKSNLLSFSYPGCRDMSVISGENISNLGALYFRTSLKLKHGSSGGSIFDRGGNLVGIASEADTAASGFISMLFGAPFGVTRAVPVQSLKHLLAGDSRSIFNLQVSDLLEFYFQNVASRTGVKRLEEGSRFLSKIKSLALDNLSGTKAASGLLIALENYPYPLFLNMGWGLDELEDTAAALALAASLEQYGLKLSLGTEMGSRELQELKDSLKSRFSSKPDSFLRLLTFIKDSKYPGATCYLFKLLLPSLVISFCCLSIWLLGIGVLIGRSQHSYLSKTLGIVLWSVFTGVFSLLILYGIYPG